MSNGSRESLESQGGVIGLIDDRHARKSSHKYRSEHRRTDTHYPIQLAINQGKIDSLLENIEGQKMRIYREHVGQRLDNQKPKRSSQLKLYERQNVTSQGAQRRQCSSLENAVQRTVDTTATQT